MEMINNSEQYYKDKLKRELLFKLLLEEVIEVGVTIGAISNDPFYDRLTYLHLESRERITEYKRRIEEASGSENKELQDVQESTEKDLIKK